VQPLMFSVLLGVLLAGCSQTAPPQLPPPQPASAPTAASRPAAREFHGFSALARAVQDDTGRCPFGHASLRQIPALGGCTFWSPEFNQTIICLQCGYAHDPAHGTWERGSTDRAAFQVPLNALTVDFPVLSGESKPQYYQSVLGTRSVHEGLLYRSAQPPTVLEAKLAAHLNDQGIATRRSSKADAAGEIITLSGDSADASIQIGLTKMRDASKTQVTFERMVK